MFFFNCLNVISAILLITSSPRENLPTNVQLESNNNTKRNNKNKEIKLTNNQATYGKQLEQRRKVARTNKTTLSNSKRRQSEKSNIFAKLFIFSSFFLFIKYNKLVEMRNYHFVVILWGSILFKQCRKRQRHFATIYLYGSSW